MAKSAELSFSSDEPPTLATWPPWPRRRASCRRRWWPGRCRGWISCMGAGIRTCTFISSNSSSSSSSRSPSRSPQLFTYAFRVIAGCSTVLVPACVMHALNLNLNDLGAQPRYPGGFVLDHVLLPCLLLPPPRRQLLPAEWSLAIAMPPRHGGRRPTPSSAAMTQNPVHAASNVNEEADHMFNCSSTHRIDTKSYVLHQPVIAKEEAGLGEEIFALSRHTFCRCEVLDRLVLFFLLCWSFSHIACNRVI